MYCGSVPFRSLRQKQEPLELVTEEYPPLTFAQGDSVTGFGTEVVSDLMRELRVRYPIRLMKWDEAFERAKTTPNVVIFTLERTPDREDQFHWIGPLGKNKSHFYVKNDSLTVISSLEDAKRLNTIATTTGWFSEKNLMENGFNNLSSTPDPLDGIKAVMEGRADAIVLTDITALNLIKQAGYSSLDLIPAFQLMETEYYIGISKQTRGKTVEKWRQAFEAISAKGNVENLRARWML